MEWTWCHIVGDYQIRVCRMLKYESWVYDVLESPGLEVTHITGLPIPVATIPTATFRYKGNCSLWLSSCISALREVWIAVVSPPCLTQWAWSQCKGRSPSFFSCLLVIESLVCCRVSSSQPSLHTQYFSKDGIRGWGRDLCAHPSANKVSPSLTMEKEWWRAMLCPSRAARKLTLWREGPCCSYLPLCHQYLKSGWHRVGAHGFLLKKYEWLNKYLFLYPLSHGNKQNIFLSLSSFLLSLDTHLHLLKFCQIFLFSHSSFYATEFSCFCPILLLLSPVLCNNPQSVFMLISIQTLFLALEPPLFHINSDC